MKKLVTIALAITLMAGTFAGCAQQATDEPAASPQTEQAPAQPPAEGAQ